MEYFSLKVLLVAALFCCVAGQPQWYTASDGRQYLLERQQDYNWFSAMNECARQNMQLLVIDTIGKNQVIVDLLKKVIGAPIDLWLAGHDTLNTGKTRRQFYWLPTGAKMSFSYWAPNEPNNDSENCVQIRSAYKEYLWNDKSCSEKFGYICEENSFQAKYKQNLIEKQKRVDQKNQALMNYNQMEQQNINALNSKADSEIKQQSINLIKSVEEMLNSTSQIIEQLHEERKQAINGWVENFNQELKNNQKEVQEILNEGLNN